MLKDVRIVQSAAEAMGVSVPGLVAVAGELERGRDRLLEYHSCRPEVAAALTRVKPKD